MACSRSMSNDEIKHRIVNIYAKFVTDVDPNRLSDWLVQEHVISIDQWQRIRLENLTIQDRCRGLLSHLLSTQHPRAFLVVRQALSEQNHYLLEVIDNQESGYGCSVQLDTETILQDKKKIEKLEKNDDDQKRAWEEEKNRLLNKIKEQETNLQLKERGTESTENSKREKPTYKALEAEIEKIRQELNNEKESNKILQVDFEDLQHKIVAVEEELEKMKAVSAELRYKSDPVLVQRIGTRAVKEEKTTISGLAILDNDLFIVSRRSSEVEVYELMKFIFSRRWNLQELSDPTHMESCKINKCLYIIDYKSLVNTYEILRIDLNGQLINKWSTGSDFASILSVTEESNVIVTLNNKNKLNKYSPDGKLQREIDLSSVKGIRFTQYAIEMSNGDFLVCNGQYFDELHRVCIVDAEGNLKKSFGGEPGSSHGQMNVPIHMAIDENRFVMVADYKNSRVLLLDSNLKFIREFLSMERHGLRNPFGICLDGTNGRLLVVDEGLKSMNKLCKDGPISIFEF